MSLLLLESTSPPPSVCLSTPGAQGHLHCRQTQVGSGIILLQITVVRLLSRPEDHTPRIEHRCWGEWSRCGILLNLFKQSARDEMIEGKGYDAEKSKEFKGYIRETNNMRKRTS